MEASVGLAQFLVIEVRAQFTDESIFRDVIGYVFVHGVHGTGDQGAAAGREGGPHRSEPPATRPRFQPVSSLDRRERRSLPHGYTTTTTEEDEQTDGLGRPR